jgi:Na+/proline symporter
VTLVLVVQQVGGFGDAVGILRASDGIGFTPQQAMPWYETLEAWAIPVCGSLMATEVIGRVIAARSGEVARRSSIAAGGLYLVVGSIPVVIALLARTFVGELSHAEQVLPTVAATVLPPIAFAIFTGGLVSAILSTVDSTLLVASGLLSHNILIPLCGITDDRRKVLLARGGVVGFGVLAYLLAMNAEGVLALVEQASAFGSAGILVTSLFALFTPFGSPRTAAATLIVALIVYLGATALGSPIPFLASLGAALLTWTIGCVRDA